MQRVITSLTIPDNELKLLLAKLSLGETVYWRRSVVAGSLRFLVTVDTTATPPIYASLLDADSEVIDEKPLGQLLGRVAIEYVYVSYVLNIVRGTSQQIMRQDIINYLGTSGTQCLYCRQPAELLRTVIFSPTISVRVRCSHCDKTWAEQYSLTGVTEWNSHS